MSWMPSLRRMMIRKAAASYADVWTCFIYDMFDECKGIYSNETEQKTYNLIKMVLAKRSVIDPTAGGFRANPRDNISRMLSAYVRWCIILSSMHTRADRWWCWFFVVLLTPDSGSDGKDFGCIFNGRLSERAGLFAPAATEKRFSLSTSVMTHVAQTYGSRQRTPFLVPDTQRLMAAVVPSD